MRFVLNCRAVLSATRRLPIVAVALVASVVVGCQQQEAILEYRIPKQHVVDRLNHVEGAGQKLTQAAAGPERTMAAIVLRESAGWFFKLSGPPAEVGKQKEDFQKFVEEVYWDLDTKADDQWLADIADEMDLPTEVVGKIGVGEQAVDVDAMNTENQKRLEQIDRKAETPTVYDVNAEQTVDLNDYDWLDSVVGSR